MIRRPGFGISLVNGGVWGHSVVRVGQWRSIRVRGHWSRVGRDSWSSISRVGWSGVRRVGWGSIGGVGYGGSNSVVGAGDVGATGGDHSWGDGTNHWGAIAGDGRDTRAASDGSDGEGKDDL